MDLLIYQSGWAFGLLASVYTFIKGGEYFLEGLSRAAA